jgi:hypothetical protein
MARLTQAFDAKSFQPDPSDQGGDFEPLPDGWYRLRVVESDLKDNQARTGTYVKLRFDVVGPTHQGRVLWANITNMHESARAQSIGGKQLQTLCDAGGIALLEETEQLIGVVVEGRVVASNYNGKAGNEIKGYRIPAGGPAPRAVMPPSAKASAAPAPSASKPPWAR